MGAQSSGKLEITELQLATTALALQFPRLNYGESMTDNDTSSSGHTSESPDDLVAKYRSKLEDVADLVARIRHEINNPLTGVLGQAQLLLREDLNDRARKRAQTIEELAIRMRDIVGQLREVQRPCAETDSAKGNKLTP
jgi:signal transduction histidine kinase